MRVVLYALLLVVAGPAWADPVALYDGHLMFTVPDGFRVATEAEVLSRYPRPQRPDNVYVRDDQAATIAVRRTPLPPTETRPTRELGVFIAERQIGAEPRITLHRHGPATINEHEWYAIEFASPMPDGSQIENLLWLTVDDGHLIIFAGNAAAAAFGQHQAAMRAAAESVMLH
jgi:hypothetical protein